MVDFIDVNKQEYRIEPFYRVWPIAMSTYYRVKDLESRPEKRSLRGQHDVNYISEIKRIWLDSKYSQMTTKML